MGEGSEVVKRARLKRALFRKETSERKPKRSCPLVGS